MDVNINDVVFVVRKGRTPPVSVNHVQWDTWAIDKENSKRFYATVSDSKGGSAYIGVSVPMETLITDDLKAEMIRRLKEHYGI